jgi:hypothetical protein
MDMQTVVNVRAPILIYTHMSLAKLVPVLRVVPVIYRVAVLFKIDISYCYIVTHTNYCNPRERFMN